MVKIDIHTGKTDGNLVRPQVSMLATLVLGFHLLCNLKLSTLLVFEKVFVPPPLALSHKLEKRQYRIAPQSVFLIFKTGSHENYFTISLFSPTP